jgi:hypothetical protein
VLLFAISCSCGLSNRDLTALVLPSSIVTSNTAERRRILWPKRYHRRQSNRALKAVYDLPHEASRVFCVVALLLTSTSGWSQIKIGTITDESNPSSKTLMTQLRGKPASHPKQFTLVSTTDSELSLLVTADCLPRKEKTDAFACFYTSQCAGGTTKTFMGGGIYGAAAADDVADNFLSSIAQDVVERWNKMVRANAIENLEACLMLTQSSCKVPDSLVPDLKAKIINMSQYLQKGGMKK